MLWLRRHVQIGVYFCFLWFSWVSMRWGVLRLCISTSLLWPTATCWNLGLVTPFESINPPCFRGVSSFHLDLSSWMSLYRYSWLDFTETCITTTIIMSLERRNGVGDVQPGGVSGFATGWGQKEGVGPLLHPAGPHHRQRWREDVQNLHQTDPRSLPRGPGPDSSRHQQGRHSNATSHWTWPQAGCDTEVPGHWGQLQVLVLCLQDWGVYHQHLPTCSVQGHHGGLQCWSVPGGVDWRPLEDHCWQVLHPLEHAPHHGGIGREACWIKKPSNSGSLYHNYKGYFSIPILALVDADYKFQWVEFGGLGHMSDAQIFPETDLRQDLEDGSINRPAPCPLTDDPEDTTDVSYYIVSDDAFALKDYCMKSYSRHSMSPKELIFNYRLPRARRVVENAFGLLAQRFRVMLSTCELIPENTRTVMKCCTTLYNLLLDRLPPPQDAVGREDAHMDVLPGAWREHVIWTEQPQPRANTDGKKVRETLADFFGSPAGIIPWQWDKACVHQPPGAANPNCNPAAAASPQAESAPPSPAPSSPQWYGHEYHFISLALFRAYKNFKMTDW